MRMFCQIAPAARNHPKAFAYILVFRQFSKALGLLRLVEVILISLDKESYLHSAAPTARFSYLLLAAALRGNGRSALSAGLFH